MPTMGMPPGSVVLPTFTFNGPLVTVDDHHQFGLELGRTFKSTINERFAAKKSDIEHLQFLARRTPDLYQAFLDLHESVYPEYVAELRGMSDGSGEPFETIFLQNIVLEFSDCASDKSEPPIIGLSCTDFMMCPPAPAACAVAHNEDNDVTDLNRTALVTARVGNGGPTWNAYTYLGELPSGAFAYNDAGFGFTLNWVGPSQPQCPGLGRGFLSRAILGATSIEAAIKIVTDPRGGAGHNYQLLWFGDESPRIVNVEAAPFGVHAVRPISAPFFHANSYLTLNIPQVRLHPDTLCTPIALYPDTSAHRHLCTPRSTTTSHAPTGMPCRNMTTRPFTARCVQPNGRPLITSDGL